MKAADAAARWGCSHTAPDGCPWCQNPDGEVWRDVSGYVPTYGIPEPVASQPQTLAEFIEKVSPGFFERSAGVS